MENKEKVYNLFNYINQRYLCSACKAERADCKDVDTKFGQFSNLSLGFISEIISKGQSMFDVMIVLESHGGGEKNQGFRPKQWETEKELKDMENYYLKSKLVRFHQQQIRKIITQLQKRGYTYIVTDLVKCFVKKGKNNKTGRDFSANFNTAINHCRSYLEEQITTFKPKIIISLGNDVSFNFFNIDKAKHGDVWEMVVECDPFKLITNASNINNNIKSNYFKTYFIHSIFPSRNTADRWVENKEWEPIISQIESILLKDKL